MCAYGREAGNATWVENITVTCSQSVAVGRFGSVGFRSVTHRSLAAFGQFLKQIGRDSRIPNKSLKEARNGQQVPGPATKQILTPFSCSHPPSLPLSVRQPTQRGRWPWLDKRKRQVWYHHPLLRDEKTTDYQCDHINRSLCSSPVPTHGIDAYIINAVLATSMP